MNPKLLVPVLLLAAAPAAQQLCEAIAASPVVVVGGHRGVRPLGDGLLLHTIAVERTLRGEAPALAYVVEWTRLSFHQRPRPGAQHMLYCLQPLTAAEVAELHIPERYAGACHRLAQHAGSHVAAGDGVVALASAVVAAEDGARPADIKQRVLALALGTDTAVRAEAARLLAARPSLLAALNDLDLAQILGRASAETDDVDLRLALATVCAERRMPDLVEALSLTLGEIEDRRVGPALGRFAVVVHGDDAAARLLARLRLARGERARRHLLLALGATSSEAALDALLRLRRLDPKDAAVEAALRQHGSRQAMEAVAGKGDGK